MSRQRKTLSRWTKISQTTCPWHTPPSTKHKGTQVTISGCLTSQKPWRCPVIDPFNSISTCDCSIASPCLANWWQEKRRCWYQRPRNKIPPLNLSPSKAAPRQSATVKKNCTQAGWQQEAAVTAGTGQRPVVPSRGHLASSVAFQRHRTV